MNDQQYPEFHVQRLAVEPDRAAHIARHDVTVEEVAEVLDREFIAGTGKLGRHLIIGPTEQGRFLAIVLGDRDEPGTYGLVTARPAHQSERKFYKDTIERRQHHD